MQIVKQRCSTEWGALLETKNENVSGLIDKKVVRLGDQLSRRDIDQLKNLRLSRLSSLTRFLQYDGDVMI